MRVKEIKIPLHKQKKLIRNLLLMSTRMVVVTLQENQEHCLLKK